MGMFTELWPDAQHVWVKGRLQAIENQPAMWGSTWETLQTNYIAALELYLFGPSSDHNKTRTQVMTAWTEILQADENEELALSDEVGDRLTLLRMLRAKVSPYIKLEGED